MSDNYFDRISVVLDEQKWIEEFLIGQGFCVVCGHDDPLDIEGHHPGRERNHTFFRISVCRNCHGRFTRRQNRWWPKESLRHDNPPELKMAFVYRGLAEAYEAKTRKIFEMHGVPWHQ